MKNLRKTIALILAFSLVFSSVIMSASFSVTAASGESEKPNPDDLYNVSVTGLFGETEGRTMLPLINNIRLGKDAWYWNSDNKTKTVNNGLCSELKYDYELEKIAMQRALETALHFDHTRPNGEFCFTAYSYSSGTSGENISAGYETVAEAEEAFEETYEMYEGQGHRRNLLSTKYKYVGIGHVVYNGYNYWAQEFGSEPSNVAATPALDAEKTLKLEVNKSLITEKTVQTDVNKIALKNKTGVLVPQVKAKIVMQETFPGIPCEVIPELEWKSRNNSIARVNGDNLFGISVGETEIYADVLGTEISIPVIVTADILTYSITYVLDGGTNSENNPSSYTNISKEIKFSEPIKGGHYFEGWYLDKAFTKPITKIEPGSNGNITLYAKWLPASADGFGYQNLSDGTLKITSCDLTGDIVIPEKMYGKTVTQLSDQLFCDKYDITSIVVPATIKAMDEYAYTFAYCYDLERITVDPKNQELCSIDGVLYSKDKSVLYCYPCSKKGSKYITNSNTRYLCPGSVTCQLELTSLYINDVDTTWEYAFCYVADLTVYYMEGGEAEKAVKRDINDGFVSTSGDEMEYPSFAVGRATLDTPVIIEAKGNEDTVCVNFESVSFAENYNVYRKPSIGGSYSKIGSTNGNLSYNDTTASKGTEYYYAVTAVAGGIESAKSDAVKGMLHTHSYSENFVFDANSHWRECDGCSETKDFSGHTYSDFVVPATEETDGKIYNRCNVCGYDESFTLIPKIGEISLSNDKFTENGAVQKPTVTVKDKDGKIIDSKYYNLIWTNENSKEAGDYAVAVQFTGLYEGAKSFAYTIEKIKNDMDFIGCSAYTKATLTLTWDKVNGVKGYRIYCAQLDKTYKVKGADVTSYKIQNLKECKNYDFSICYFVNNGNGDIYSEYSESFRYCTRPSPVTVTELKSSSSGTKHSFTVTHSTVKNVSGYEVKYQLVGSKNYKTYNRTNADPKTIEVAKAGTYTVWTRAYKSAKYDGVNKFKANGDWSESYTIEVK